MAFPRETQKNSRHGNGFDARDSVPQSWMTIGAMNATMAAAFLQLTWTAGLRNLPPLKMRRNATRKCAQCQTE